MTEIVDNADMLNVPQCVSCAAYTAWGDTYCNNCGETFGWPEAAAFTTSRPQQEDSDGR